MLLDLLLCTAIAQTQYLERIVHHIAFYWRCLRYAITQEDEECPTEKEREDTPPEFASPPTTFKGRELRGSFAAGRAGT